MNSLIDHVAGRSITQGEGSGRPFAVLPWQRRYLRGAFSVQGDAALSVARGNGKTTTTRRGCAYGVYRATQAASRRSGVGRRCLALLPCAPSAPTARSFPQRLLRWKPPPYGPGRSLSFSVYLP